MGNELSEPPKSRRWAWVKNPVMQFFLWITLFVGGFQACMAVSDTPEEAAAKKATEAAESRRRLAAASGARADASVAPVKPAGTSGRYDQTWTKSYKTTTCAEWRTSMTAKERFVAAADMLGGARKANGADSLQPDSLTRQFQAEIDAGCEPIGTLTIADAAVGVYLIENDTFAP